MLSQFINSILAYSDRFVTFSILFVVSFFVLLIIKQIFLSRLYQLAQKTTNTLDSLIYDLMKTWNLTVLIVIAAYLSLQFIVLPSEISKVLDFAMGISFGWVSLQTTLVVVSYLFTRFIAQRQKVEPDFDPTVIIFLRQVIAVSVWIVAILVIIQNLGYEISTLVGGLGLGGLAVAFAVQNVLSDVFSSFSIYFDKPFKIGDYIVVGSDSGTVKKIGIKSTRLTTLQGQELVISNKELTESRVHNYKKMQTRRVSVLLGLDYGTDLHKLKQIPTLIQDVIQKQEDVDFDRCHCKLLTDSNIQFETVYTVTSPEFNVYMDSQQAINFAILEVFEKEGIHIAYPTSRIISSKA